MMKSGDHDGHYLHSNNYNLIYFSWNIDPNHALPKMLKFHKQFFLLIAKKQSGFISFLGSSTLGFQFRCLSLGLVVVLTRT